MNLIKYRVFTHVFRNFLIDMDYMDKYGPNRIISNKSKINLGHIYSVGVLTKFQGTGDFIGIILNFF